jgi:hypothetical protein
MTVRTVSNGRCFSTGHASEIEHQAEGVKGTTAHLLKPYDFDTLMRTIRKLA